VATLDQDIGSYRDEGWYQDEGWYREEGSYQGIASELAEKLKNVCIAVEERPFRMSRNTLKDVMVLHTFRAA
jgi:hypothetical protein